MFWCTDFRASFVFVGLEGWDGPTITHATTLHCSTEKLRVPLLCGVSTWNAHGHMDAWWWALLEKHWKLYEAAYCRGNHTPKQPNRSWWWSPTCDERRVAVEASFSWEGISSNKNPSIISVFCPSIWVSCNHSQSQNNWTISVGH